MVIVAPYFWGVGLYIIQARNNSNILIVQSAPLKILRIRKYASIFTIKHA